ncbi:MAG: hypothetical protein U0Y10_24245 [Spirosomataceae bacterium]
MVEVFKTNVSNQERAQWLVAAWMERFPNHRISFDLEDCDRILRIQGDEVCTESVIDWLSSQGHDCLLL